MICSSYKSFFKILADDCKINIINLLTKGPHTVNGVADRLGYEQSRVSHALNVLRENGFVVDARKGKSKEYSIEPKIMMPLLKLIDMHVEKYHKSKCTCKGTRWREIKCWR